MRWDVFLVRYLPKRLLCAIIPYSTKGQSDLRRRSEAPGAQAPTEDRCGSPVGRAQSIGTRLKDRGRNDAYVILVKAAEDAHHVLTDECSVRVRQPFVGLACQV